MKIDIELYNIFSIWASGGFHNSQAAYEEFEAFLKRRLRKHGEDCAIAVSKQLNENLNKLDKGIAQACLDIGENND